MLGLLLTMEDNWHVYWVNAGDSGEPPHIHWTLPAGIDGGADAVPDSAAAAAGDPFMDFGYEDIVAFPVTISAAAGMKAGPVHLDAQVELAGVRAGLRSGEGAPGDRSDGAAGGSAD